MTKPSRDCDTEAQDLGADARDGLGARRRPISSANRITRARRVNLDFDFEKCCSVSLSHVNIYACLVCGAYFQGRGPSTHANAHALETNHHMFMKLSDTKVYCLPEVSGISELDVPAPLDLQPDPCTCLVHPHAPLWPHPGCSLQGYEVIDRSLDDIRAVLRPTFTKDEVT